MQLPAARVFAALRVVGDAYRNKAMGADYHDTSVEELLAAKAPDWAVSALVLAIPSGLMEMRFRWGGQCHSVVIPAMYMYSKPMADSEQAVRDALAPHGWRAEWAWLPARTLAGYGGFGRYGRNNMVYIEGLGSFPWLVSFWSDMPCVRDPWTEPIRMERCGGCRRCVVACPSKCVPEDGTLIRSDRCLNFATEYPSKSVGWMRSEWVRELLGCMACQLCCPANEEFRGMTETGPNFSEEETSMLLYATTADAVAEDVWQKLGGDDLKPYLGVIQRNLKWMISHALQHPPTSAVEAG